MLRLYNKNNPPERLEQVVDILNDGGVIIFPTNTTYAFGCHALKERAVEKICKLRNITPALHPLSIICYDFSAISEYAKISTPTYKLMKRNFPGAFTFILPGKKILPKIFHNHTKGEIGIKMPENIIIHDILERLHAPLMTASLPYDEYEDVAYYTNPEIINDKWNKQVNLIIDGGIGHIGQSTIVDCHDDKFEILRQGDGVLLL